MIRLGKCKNGKYCFYAHTQQEICAPYGSTQEQALVHFNNINCRRFDNGVCVHGKLCVFKHRKKKMALLNRRYYQVHLDIYRYLTRRAHLDKVDKFILNYEPQTPRLSIFEQVENGEHIEPLTPSENPFTKLLLSPSEYTTPPKNSTPTP